MRSNRSGRSGIVCHFRVTSRDWRRIKTEGRDLWLGGFHPATAWGGGSLHSKSIVFNTMVIITRSRRREPPNVGVIDIWGLFSPFALAVVYANNVG